MLLDRADALSADLRSRSQIQAAASQAQAFKTRANQFAPLAQGLEQGLAQLRAVASAGFEVATVAARPALRTQAEELLARFRQDPSSLTTADSKVRFEFTQGVRKAIDEIAAAAQAGWSKAVAARSEAPSEQVLTALDAIAAYRPAVARLRKALDVLRGLQQQTPDPTDLVTRLAVVGAAEAEKNAALEMLQGSDLPAEVLSFLRKSGQGGAGLADYTAAVDAWLTQRGLRGAFRIVPAARS
jgi:hypothetical protein